MRFIIFGDVKDRTVYHAVREGEGGYLDMRYLRNYSRRSIFDFCRQSKSQGIEIRYWDEATRWRIESELSQRLEKKRANSFHKALIGRKQAITEAL